VIGGQQAPLQQVEVPGAGVGMVANDRGIQGRREVPGWRQVRQRVLPPSVRLPAPSVRLIATMIFWLSALLSLNKLNSDFRRLDALR
jgi:hypothetical protein